MWRAHRPRRAQAGRSAVRPRLGPAGMFECTAIALSRIGTGLDIQGGGSDLIFPHHEFSAAHAESVTGERRFARALCARRNDRLGRAQDEQEPRQPRPGVQQLRADGRRTGGHPARPACRSLSPADRQWERLGADEANTRLQRWRAATVATRGTRRDPTCWPGCCSIWPTDLDTPKALAALDGWTTDALTYGGPRTPRRRARWRARLTRCSASRPPTD